MTLSPFHGIFGALKQDSASSRAQRALPAVSLSGKHEEEAAVPARNVGQIAVDIYEVDNYYIIRAPVAGVRLSDLDIEVDGNVVTIRGRRQASEDIPAKSYHVQECFWGPFERCVTLPTVVDPRKVKASFSKDGILKILVPKEEKVRIVRINEG